MNKQVKYRVIGEDKMHCKGCETRVIDALNNLKGVQEVQADANEQRISIIFNTDDVGPEELEGRLEELGYKLVPA